MQTSGKVAAIARGEDWQPPTIWLDAIGLGYGVLDRLRELGVDVTAFIASARTASRDRFLNLRAEAWWAAREAFQRSEVDLDPNDRALAGQLASVRYSLASNGSIQIASKDSMRTSPDRADALVIALYARGESTRAEAFVGMVEKLRQQDSRPQRRRSTEEMFGGQMPTELAWSTGPAHEKIVPNAVIRNSAGGRYEP
jgi:hypothetical protein